MPIIFFRNSTRSSFKEAVEAESSPTSRSSKIKSLVSSATNAANSERLFSAFLFWGKSFIPNLARSLAESALIERSSREISPSSGSVSPDNILRAVVFPAPFGPIRPTISPEPIDRLTLSRTHCCPRFLQILFASNFTFGACLHERNLQPQSEVIDSPRTCSELRPYP